MGPNTYHLLCLHTNGNGVSALPFMCKELRGKTETHCSYFFLSQAHQIGSIVVILLASSMLSKQCALLTYFEGFVVFLHRTMEKFGQKESSQVPVGFSNFGIRCIFVGFMVVLHPLRPQKRPTEKQRPVKSKGTVLPWRVKDSTPPARPMTGGSTGGCALLKNSSHLSAQQSVQEKICFSFMAGGTGNGIARIFTVYYTST